ncbi:MAG: TetR/AcrR family transcriptional regulator [Candidatus Adiutrix sp.]|jgi:AcrR family transcriptional regulator|nr:TetR/AcrR family transcriptional regulator [Candidatus Adiutrix sp.]
MTKKVGKTSQDPAQVFDILGRRYTLPLTEGGSPTKERILMTSTVLFARKGYAAVSMRDIAAATGIKPSSLYNHFESKEKLWAATLEHLKKLWLIFFDHLTQLLARAKTFEEALGHMYNEPKRLVNTFSNYGFSLIMLEQVHDPLAAETFDFFMSRSLKAVQGCFDDCVARGLVPAFDTHSAALLLLHNIFMGIATEVQDYEGRRTLYKPIEMFAGMERFFLKLLDRK